MIIRQNGSNQIPIFFSNLYICYYKIMILNFQTKEIILYYKNQYKKLISCTFNHGCHKCIFTTLSFS